MPDIYPKISIVTSTYNQGAYIEDCIGSIIGQEYPNLEYIIIDGGSTDNTLDIIHKYAKYIHFWTSEKDNGLYHALQKGFQRSTGEIMGWLNSDDILHRKSLFTLRDIFLQHTHIDWLQGYPSVIDNTGRIVYHRAPRFRPESFYMKEYHDGIFIQQESTYWRRSLWEKAGAHISTRYKYAGDFELWMRFFQFAQLSTTDAMIGAFRVRGVGQLSSDNYSIYLKECDEIVEEVMAGLPAEKVGNIKKLQRLNRINHRLPFLKRLLKGKQSGGIHVYYNFQEAAFRISNT